MQLRAQRERRAWERGYVLQLYITAIDGMKWRLVIILLVHLFFAVKNAESKRFFFLKIHHYVIFIA